MPCVLERVTTEIEQSDVSGACVRCETRERWKTMTKSASGTKYRSEIRNRKHTYPIRCPCDDTKYARRLLPHTLYRMFAHTL